MKDIAGCVKQVEAVATDETFGQDCGSSSRKSQQIIVNGSPRCQAIQAHSLRLHPLAIDMDVDRAHQVCRTKALLT